MKSKIWLLIGGACLITTHPMADDSNYDTRQMTINPGNVMDGMFNPMRNFFGGSNRYSEDYHNYRYAPPPYHQPGYGYPGAGYGYPPPGYQPPPLEGAYPSYSPTRQAPAPRVSAQPPVTAEPPQTPPSPGYGPTPAAEPTYYKQFRFRPLDKSGTSADISPQVPPEPTGDQAILTPQRGYEPSLAIPPGAEAGQMKFRPLDKPGGTD